jgi:hypothetical protein
VQLQPYRTHDCGRRTHVRESTQWPKSRYQNLPALPLMTAGRLCLRKAHGSDRRSKQEASAAAPSSAPDAEVGASRTTPGALP